MAKLTKANLSNVSLKSDISTYIYDNLGKSKLFKSVSNLFQTSEDKIDDYTKLDAKQSATNIRSAIVEAAEALRELLQTGAEAICAELSSATAKIMNSYGGVKKEEEEIAIDLEDNSTQYSSSANYKPVIKTGSFNTYLYIEGYPCEYYSGKYLEFVNEDGISFKVPLATAKYENNKIVFVPMTDDQIENYTEIITNYYNDIMKNYDSYSNQYKAELSERLDSVSLVYIDPASKSKLKASNNSWAAYCYSQSYTNHSSIVIDTSTFVSPNLTNALPKSNFAYNYMVETFTHETGHAYANNRVYDILEDRDKSYTWQTIYSQVSSDSSSANILRSYSVSNQYELFADSVMYYYHSPNKLKMIEINVDGYNNLYDYMSSVLN